MLRLLLNLMFAFFLACLSILASPGYAADASDRFWFMWEHIEPAEFLCGPDQSCPSKRTYLTRLFADRMTPTMLQLFGGLDYQAMRNGTSGNHPDAPRVCQHYDAEVMLGFDPEAMEISQKPLILKGISGIHFDISSLKAPVGFQGDFGARLQSEFEQRFEAAGIEILSEDDMLETAGQPELNIYFSHANPETGCHYSVFATLRQTALLTRNVRTKLKVGTWSGSAGPSSVAIGETEFDAILGIADSFVRDWKVANDVIP